MTAKQYLEQAQWLDEKINANLAEIERLRTSFLSTTDYTKVGGRSSATGDRVADIVEKIIELEAEINSETDRFVDLKREIRERVASIENDRYRLVLQERYLNFRDLDVIKEIMKCTRKHVTRLHGYALYAFQKKYSDVL